MQKNVSPPHKQFTMLGTIHRDPEAARLLERCLDSWRPEAISLEFSRYGLKYRKKHGNALRQKVHETIRELRVENVPVNGEALASVLAYIELPSEYTLALSYSTGHEAPLFLIDMDRFSCTKLQSINDLIAKDNLRTLLTSSSLSSGGHRERGIASLFFEKGVKAFEYTEEMQIRDRCMARHLVRLLAGFKGTRFLHICGWQHLYDPGRCYDPLNPTKAFIYDKALCI